MTHKRMYYIIGIVVFCGMLFGYLMYNSNRPMMPMVAQSIVQQVANVINMTEEEFHTLKEQQITRMIADSALANGLNPYALCGLAYHESDRYKFAHKKIKDSNARFSYGLFQIQLETAILYDKSATDAKLLTPAYNTYVACLIFKKNLARYGGNYEFAIAAHNAGTVYNNKITNVDFVKKVNSAIGEITTKYYSLESKR